MEPACQESTRLNLFYQSNVHNYRSARKISGDNLELDSSFVKMMTGGEMRRRQMMMEALMDNCLKNRSLGVVEVGFGIDSVHHCKSCYSSN